MKNKRLTNSDYSMLKKKIFFQIAVVIICSMVCVLFLNSYFQGNFGNLVVKFLTSHFVLDEDIAKTIHRSIFGANQYLIILLVALLSFFIFFRFFLSWVIKYFDEINNGIDSLVSDRKKEIKLSPEMEFAEKKLNTIKHAIEKQRLETQLAEQRKNDLVVYLAHDLKTPLTSVIGYLTLLRDEIEISPALREKYLSISLEKAERLEDLINEFFEITRFNISTITLELSRVNLTRMLEQLVYEFNPLFSDKNLQCVLNIESNIMIKFDVDKVQRVFDNLLNNAINYSFENSTIEINVTQDNKETKIKFLNHGNTISAEKIERIFEQFYRLDPSRTSKNGGAGLGLAIAKEIIKLHHGTITACSNDEIIVFEISIPVL